MNKFYIFSKLSTIFKKEFFLLLISLSIINTVFFLNSNMVLFFSLFFMILFSLIYILEPILKMFNNIQNEHNITLINSHKSYIQNLLSIKTLHHAIVLFPNNLSELCDSWKSNDFSVIWVLITNNKNYLFFIIDNIITDLLLNDHINNNLNYPNNKSSFLN